VKLVIKIAVATSVIFVAAALAATTTAKAADWHLARLDSVATAVAGHPVSVYCGSSEAEWVDVSRAIIDDGDNLLGFTYPTANTDPFGNVNEIYLNPRACTTFQIYFANGWGTTAAARDAGLYWLAGAALTLVHESIHQSGVADEGQTECAAIKLMPKALPAFFGVPRTITVHHRRVVNPTFTRLLAWGKVWHQGTPPEYQAVC
jgi:hypothetical protein